MAPLHWPPRRIVVLTAAGISRGSGLDIFRDRDGLRPGVRIQDADPGGGSGRPPRRRPSGAIRSACRLSATPAGTASRTRRSGPIPRLRPWPVSRPAIRANSCRSPRTSTICTSVPAPGAHAWRPAGGRLPRLAGRSRPGSGTSRRAAAVRPAASRGNCGPSWSGSANYPCRWIERIAAALAGCDLFLSIGTSGSAYPAAGFVAEAREPIPIRATQYWPAPTASNRTRTPPGARSAAPGCIANRPVPDHLQSPLPSAARSDPPPNALP